MDLEEYRKEYLETARAVAVLDGDFEVAAFVSEAARRLTDAEELADFESCYYEGTGYRSRKLRVDGFAVDDADGSIRLVIADYRGSAITETLSQAEAMKSFSQLQGFIEDSLNGKILGVIEESSPGYGLANHLYHHRSSITRFRLYLLTDTVLSGRVKDLPQSTLDNRPVEYHIWDIARFHRTFESSLGLDELEVDFTEFTPEGLTCIEAGQTDSNYLAYLCVIPGDILADIYDRYGSRLLEGNVRSFLSLKGKVNKGIQATIRSEPTMFFAYNNGIATTATKAEVKKTPAGLRLIRASYLQIVNGGQTTAALATAKRRDAENLSSIFVQMKLSVVPIDDSDKMNEMIQSISRFANSQNKVSEADFFSNHPLHRRLESFSRRLWAPAVGGAQHETHWFYERARGQYLNEQSKMSVSERKKFEKQNPRTQVITKTDLAKYENTWSQLPHVVSLGAQKNFLRFAEETGTRWNQNEEKFNEGYYRDAVARSILFRHTEKLVSNQTWYQNGYRANIVAYTIAKLSQMIEKKGSGRVMDFRSTWSRQGISTVLDAQLAVIGREVFEVIVNPEGGFQNVTEWCKKELCWQRVQALDLQLLPKFRAELLDKLVAKEAAKDDKVIQKLDNGIEAQTTVFSLGAAYWGQLRVWARQNARLSPEEEKVVTIAARIPEKIPTEFQSARLLQVKERMESEGYRPQ